MEPRRPDDLEIERDRGVVLVRLNRPEKLNALTFDQMRRLGQLLDEVAENDDDRVLVLTGSGRGFCSGADISSGPGSPLVPARPGSRREWFNDRWKWVTGLRAMDKPTIAAVNGVTAGAGLSLALACDLRWAAESVRVVPAFVQRAMVPDAGASYLLPRLVGPGRALDLLWRSQSLTATECAALGLFEHVLPDSDLLPAVMAFARELADGPAVAIELTKRAVYQGLAATTLEEHAEYEQSLWKWSHGAEDYLEGRRAFQERRPPNFTGR